MKTFSLIATALATLATFVSADGGSFTNNSGKTLYARSAAGADTGHDSTPVAPGATYQHNIVGAAGSNRAIKISTTVTGLDDDCYNVEWYTDANGKLWYNLSHDHGDPVIEFARTMTAANCPNTIHCASNDGSCDYPNNMDSCQGGGEIAFVLG